MATAVSPPLAVSDAKVVGLISAAHFFSPLFILALPPIFIVLQRDLEVGATQLGVLIAAANLTTMVCQTPTGFLVDRFGPARILVIGHSLMAVSVGLLGLWPNYGWLLALMVFVGLGNAVYHPADYAILAARVTHGRIGRAFSIHTFGGYVGFAAAPLTMVPLTQMFGWRAALLLIGLAGLSVTMALLLNRAE